MPKKVKLEAAVTRARANWRKMCANHDATAEDRHRAFAAWKRAESVRNKALLLWKSALADRRRAISDRRKANVNSDWLKENADRRRQVRRP
jgi:hypothetical protein